MMATARPELADTSPSASPIAAGDRVALVTGAASGMGRAAALALGDKGFRVVCADVQREPRVEGFESDRTPTDILIQAIGVESAFVEVDVSLEERVIALFDTCRESFGRLDVLVNAAGIRGNLGDVTRTTVAEFDRVMSVNARGVWMCCKEAIQTFLAAGTEGRIINIASVNGLVGAPDESAYCASKGAVVLLTKSLALEVASAGITVNAVCPGYVKTAMSRIEAEDQPKWEILERATPAGRWGDPADIASVVCFLASDASSWLTGVSLPVDGGVTATCPGLEGMRWHERPGD